MDVPRISPREPAAGRRIGPRQFSLLVLLLTVLVACVVAGYWGELRRRRGAERNLEEAQRRVEGFRRLESQDAAPRSKPSVLQITDPELVHIKVVSPSRGARDVEGWQWRIYLPDNKQWWLYV